MSISERAKKDLVGTFRFKLGELKRHSSLKDEQSLKECAAIIRDLFISDSNGLAGRIAREITGYRSKYHRRFIFEAQVKGDTIFQKQDKKWLRYDGWTDAGRVLREPRKYSKDDFFKLPVIEMDGEGGLVAFSVIEIIKFISNKLGSVHFDYKKDGTKNDLLYDMQEFIDINRRSPILQTMDGISAVVIKTCEVIDLKLRELGY